MADHACFLPPLLPDTSRDLEEARFPVWLAFAGDGGVVDGMGSVWWQRAKSKQLNYSRGPLIQFLWSTDVIVANITLLNSSYWALHPVYSRSVSCAGAIPWCNLVHSVQDCSGDAICKGQKVHFLLACVPCQGAWVWGSQGEALILGHGCVVHRWAGVLGPQFSLLTPLRTLPSDLCRNVTLGHLKIIAPDDSPNTGGIFPGAPPRKGRDRQMSSCHLSRVVSGQAATRSVAFPWVFLPASSQFLYRPQS